MTDLAQIKLLVLSLAMLGAVRLFATCFLGDCEAGPAVRLTKRSRDVASALAAVVKTATVFCSRPRPVNLTQRPAHGQRGLPRAKP
jgi:hypothetical protein